MSSMYRLPRAHRRPVHPNFRLTVLKNVPVASFWDFRLSHAQPQGHAHCQSLMNSRKPSVGPFSAPLTEVCHDVLYEAVSIFLPVRQQLQRIDQMSAQNVRYCMCFEDLGLIDTFTCFVRPKACLVASNLISLHISRTTNCCALFRQRPTICSLPKRNCCNSNTSRTS